MRERHTFVVVSSAFKIARHFSWGEFDRVSRDEYFSSGDFKSAGNEGEIVTEVEGWNE